MRAEVTIKLETGQVLFGVITSLENAESGAPSMPATPSEASRSLAALDFSVPVRPFMVQHAGKLSGSKKFALLLAHHAKGKTDVPVDRALLIEQWNKMTGLLGGKFNGAHEARAKDAGWVYVPSSGSLALLRNWEKILL